MCEYTFFKKYIQKFNFIFFNFLFFFNFFYFFYFTFFGIFLFFFTFYFLVGFVFKIKKIQKNFFFLDTHVLKILQNTNQSTRGLFFIKFFLFQKNKI